MDSEESECGSGGGSNSLLGLRVAAIFVIMAGSTAGTLFPILARRSTWLHIATAFIHLLAPGLEALSSPCLAPAWAEYPYALALCLLSIFTIFITEIVAFRWGTARLAKIGVHHDAHGHEVGSHAAHGPEGEASADDETSSASPHPPPPLPLQKHEHDDDIEAQHARVRHSLDDSAAAQVIGIAILEFGVLLHSVLIGLTLAVDEKFKILFVVIVFHQTFEGLGLGARLAYLRLPPKYSRVAPLAALVYGLSTPLGVAVGLGLREAYNPTSATASIVSGVLDSLSAGVLIYTGLVELLAHEFLFNKEVINASNGRLAYAIGSMLCGCALMAMLGKWA
ncbi:ZIP-like iron-zinc transporter [Mycena rebaudengoi]|nr:ZIP-like iron-zinc transporter [Mycena rebaudengoi]